jgi:peptide chain release factor 2
VQREIADLETRTAAPEFWKERESASKTAGRLAQLRRRLEPVERMRTAYRDVRELYELAVAEGDNTLEEELDRHLGDLETRVEEQTTLALLGGEDDGADAFVTIHSGAGGTEACDWVSMLYRMYTRWAERRGWSVEVIDLHGAEGGIRSVTVQISGEYAFGHLKAENGVHRLVRISPFDAAKRRHTSFASVTTSPVLEDDLVVTVKPEDLRVDTYHSSGAGGQHVNKTESAVRITHLPTGIVVACQSERSQIQNRATAMKVLKSRLYEHYRDERDRERQAKEPEKKDISWGHQIRSYVFQPYQLVKDHRTDVEMGNVQSVMDGGIDRFVEAYLKLTARRGD